MFQVANSITFREIKGNYSKLCSYEQDHNMLHVQVQFLLKLTGSYWRCAVSSAVYI